MGCSITGISLLISEISLFPVLLLATLVLSYIKEEICLLWEGRRRRETSILLLLPVKKQSASYGLVQYLDVQCLSPCPRQTCLLWQFAWRFCNAWKQKGCSPKKADLSLLSEPCAKPKMTNTIKISWEDWLFLSLENNYWNGKLQQLFRLLVRQTNRW